MLTTGEDENGISKLDDGKATEVLSVDDMAGNTECREGPRELVKQCQ